MKKLKIAILSVLVAAMLTACGIQNTADSTVDDAAIVEEILDEDDDSHRFPMSEILNFYRQAPVDCIAIPDYSKINRDTVYEANDKFENYYLVKAVLSPLADMNVYKDMLIYNGWEFIQTDEDGIDTYQFENTVAFLDIGKYAGNVGLSFYYIPEEPSPYYKAKADILEKTVSMLVDFDDVNWRSYGMGYIQIHVGDDEDFKLNSMPDPTEFPDNASEEKLSQITAALESRLLPEYLIKRKEHFYTGDTDVAYYWSRYKEPKHSNVFVSQYLDENETILVQVATYCTGGYLYGSVILLLLSDCPRWVES